MSKSYKTICTKDFKRLREEITKQSSVVLVHATWCGHCKDFKPTWEKISKEYIPKNKKHLKLFAIESEVLKDMQSKDAVLFKFLVRDPNMVSFPTVVVFKKGDKRTTVSLSRGVMNEVELKKKIHSLIPNTKETKKNDKKEEVKAHPTKAMVTQSKKQAYAKEDEENKNDMMYDFINEQIHTVPKRQSAHSRNSIDRMLAKYLGLKI